MKKDAIVVGCGLSGAVVARELANNGFKVLIVDRRGHIGGNMYDFYDEHGILVHKYGPHTFHTVKKELFEYMNRYAEWDEYHLTCGAEIMGKCTPTPFNFQTIDDYYDKDEAEKIKKHIKEVFGDRSTATVLEVLSCDDEVVRGYGDFLFEHDYSLYSAKQWGVSPNEIDPSILKRVPLRSNYEEGYFDDEYQYMPHTTYTEFFNNLLRHENIEVRLKTDALEHLHIKKNIIKWDEQESVCPLIFTGAVDELFDHRLGSLPYRSLRFEWRFEENVDSKQDMPVVAYPEADGFTRIVEFKKLPMQNVKGTSYEIEYPLQYDENADQEPYYPLLTEKSQKDYKGYKKLAAGIENLYCCGRLADFKYYNMDQALEKALEVSKEVLDALK